MNLRRIRQVVVYGWKHSDEVAAAMGKGFLYHVKVFLDILYCYRVYRMWSNQYVNERFHLLSNEERIILGKKYYEKGKKRDAWQKDFVENRKFLAKYSDIKYEIGAKRDKRNRVYAERYNAGKNLMVEYDVNISRQHYLDGSIRIGDNVLLAKHAFIDYSGNVVIENGVKIANGVIIESHHDDIDAYNKGLCINIPSKLLIKEKAYIGSRAVILDSCNYIGKYARIGAGAVVTKDVPDYAVAVGVPAKVIRYINEN